MEADELFDKFDSVTEPYDLEFIIKMHAYARTISIKVVHREW